jgi:hypothetical protein
VNITSCQLNFEIQVGVGSNTSRVNNLNSLRERLHQVVGRVSEMEAVVEVIKLGGQILMAVMPVAPYAIQCYEMIQKNSAEGFSPYLCLVLLVSKFTMYHTRPQPD